jgi:hypothetical protein
MGAEDRSRVNTSPKIMKWKPLVDTDEEQHIYDESSNKCEAWTFLYRDQSSFKSAPEAQQSALIASKARAPAMRSPSRCAMRSRESGLPEDMAAMLHRLNGTTMSMRSDPRGQPRETGKSAFAA